MMTTGANLPVFNGEYHDWTSVCVGDTDEIDYNHCAICGHVEKPKEHVNG